MAKQTETGNEKRFYKNITKCSQGTFLNYWSRKLIQGSRYPAASGTQLFVSDIEHSKIRTSTSNSERSFRCTWFYKIRRWMYYNYKFATRQKSAVSSRRLYNYHSELDIKLQYCSCSFRTDDNLRERHRSTRLARGRITKKPDTKDDNYDLVSEAWRIASSLSRYDAVINTVVQTLWIYTPTADPRRPPRGSLSSCPPASSSMDITGSSHSLLPSQWPSRV